MGSFLLYSVHEGIRGIPLDPADKSDALVPVSGTSLAVGIDFHAGELPSGTSWLCLDILCIFFVHICPVSELPGSQTFHFQFFS